MNTQTDIGSEVEKAPKWQAIRHWLTAIDEGLNFDPDEYTYDRLRHLSQKVDEIETRLVELESERKS
jgi:hypothetical protein